MDTRNAARSRLRNELSIAIADIDVAYALVRAASRLLFRAQDDVEKVSTRHARVPRRVSGLLMSRNLAELVGQAGSLRPIVNRPLAASASSQEGRLTIGRRLPACPTSSRRFPIGSENPR